MTNEPTLYHIPATNFARLEKEIEKINRRAKKLETDPVTLKVHAEEHVTRTDELWGTEYEEVFFVCSVEGAAPQVKGFTLIASIQPVDDKENLVREVPGEQCPKQYRTADMSCDHCQTNVRRKSVFVLKNEFGEHRQVGRNCLQDYLGGVSPESMLGRAEYMMDFAKLARDAEESDWGWGGTGIRCVPINQFVITCAAVIQKLGWMSRSKAYECKATADIAWDICVNPSKRISFARDNRLKVTDDNITLAKQAVEWASKIDETNAPNNYLHDVGVCCRQQYVTLDRAGYVASVLQAYQWHIAEQQPVADSTSNYVGTVDERCAFSDLVISENRELEANDFGPSRLIKFTDPNGNILVWFTSKSPDWVKIGEKVTIAARVKAHRKFGGIKQTIIKLVTLKDER